MTAFWTGYRSFPRLAAVQNETSGQTAAGHTPAQPWEVLRVLPGFIVFSSDGYSAEISPDSRFYALRSGDIITVDDRGVVYRIFSPEEDDATVFMTGHCNSNCVMCPSSDAERRRDGGMPADWLLRYIQMLPAGTGHLTVTGGEPTLRTELFFKVMGAIGDRFPESEVLLLTNGRAFASKTVTGRLLDRCPPYLCAAVPLHGAAEDLHDQITQTPGSFRQTVAGIRHLMAAGIAVELRVVVSRLNLHNLRQIAAFIIRHFPKAAVVHFVGLETRGSCAKNFSRVYVDLRESAKWVLPAVKLLAGAGIDAALYNYPLCAVDRGYWMLCRQSISPEKVRFPAECAGCEARSLCGGFFGTTLSMAGPAVKPVHFSYGRDGDAEPLQFQADGERPVSGDQ